MAKTHLKTGWHLQRQESSFLKTLSTKYNWILVFEVQKGHIPDNWVNTVVGVVGPG